VITYKDENGQPQFWADLSNWNLAPDLSDALFAFTPPNGAERIQFLAEVRSSPATATLKKAATNDLQIPTKIDCNTNDRCIVLFLVIQPEAIGRGRRFNLNSWID
jgi:hypothetical protein